MTKTANPGVAGLKAIDDLIAKVPGAYAKAHDAVQLLGAHAGGLALLAGHQAGIGEVGGGLVDARPLGGLVVDGVDDGHAILRAEIVELLAGEGRTAHLHGVTQANALLIFRQQF